MPLHNPQTRTAVTVSLQVCAAKGPKMVKWKILALCVLAAGLPAAAQFPDEQPRIMLGADAALFRITLDDFTRVYEHRAGPSYGAFLGVRAYMNYYVLGKYNSFAQDGKTKGSNAAGASLAQARWQEHWFTIGLRNPPAVTRRLGSFYGFGMAFFRVQEEDSVNIFKNKGLATDDGLNNGFYLELGLDYFPQKSLAAYFETQISSGGVRGKTGFEAFSIGGFRFALGLMWRPF
jgi:hypothetical protein